MTEQPEQNQTPQPSVLIPHQPKVNSDLYDYVSFLFSVNNPGIYNPSAPFLVMPEKTTVVDMEQNMPFPRMVRKNIMFVDSPSFLSYFKLFKDSYLPRLFCKNDDEMGMEILCVFDYDGPGREQEGHPTSAPQPMWNAHKASLQLAYHPDYKAIKDSENQWFSQQDFALFIEENTHLFQKPDGATMLEIAQHLKGVRNANWQSGKRLANGETKLEYIETIEARAVRSDLVVPELLTLVSPIYDGYETREYNADFRWRMEDGGKIVFSYRLLTKLVERNATEQVKLSIVKETGLPLYNVADFNGITAE